MLINKDLNTYRPLVDEAVKDLHALVSEIGHEDLKKTVNDLRNRVNEPFMFVIVGEVKAGKSSFINALLETDKEICKVSPAPMTDTIQQILYGETEQIVSVNPFLKKLYYPIEILREIAIVDTPGTNTIVANHQEVTEDFIPACDLVVFVFECKNPYRQSAWEFFDFIHADWRKKVIFVLQQKDLMPPNDLEINEKGVREYAEKKGMINPTVFSVSAKLEQEGNKYDSGFFQIKDYIYRNITGGKAPILKLQNNISTSQNILERVHQGIVIRKEQFLADTEFRRDIRQTLDNQALKSNKQVDILKENLLNAFDKITKKYELELSEGLSFGNLIKRSFTGMFGGESNPKTWLQDISTRLQSDLQREMKDRLDDSVNDLADSIQQMAKIIDLKIRNSKTVLKDDYEIFSDIADRRSNVLKDLQDTFQKFMSKAENFKETALLGEKGGSISPSITMGSGAAIVGVVVMAVAQTAAIDITGGVITALGLAFAGITIGIQRGKILGTFSQEVKKGREKLEETIDERLKNYVHQIKQRIESNFAAFDAMVETEDLQLRTIEEKHGKIEANLRVLEHNLQSKI
jgi:ribosome biogenesis GTPase A